MSSKPLVSIVLPTRNRARLLPHALNSLLNQSYENIEIIIVDDSSTDRTPKILNKYKRKYKKIKIIRNERKQGLPKSRNIGLASSRGSFVFFSEDDLILSSDVIEILVDTYLIYKDIIKLGGIAPRIILLSNQRDYTRIPEGNTIVGLLNTITGENLYYYDISRRNIAITLHPPATSLLPKHLFNIIGNYYTGYSYNYVREESDLYIRALKKGFIFIYQPKAITYHLSGFKGGCTIENILLNELSSIHNQAVFLLRNFGIKALPMLGSYLLKRIFKIKYLTNPQDANKNLIFIEKIGFKIGFFEAVRKLQDYILPNTR